MSSSWLLKKGKNGDLSIENVRTNFMIGDPLTKTILAKIFHENIVHMSLVSYDDMKFQRKFLLCVLIIPIEM